jgi:hypothetical protein
MLKALLNGQATGTSLFSAWCAGIFAALFCTFLFISFAPDYLLAWIGFLGGLVFLSIWESVLLTSSWWRRAVWGISYAFILLRLFYDIKNSDWHYYCVGQLVHGALLIGTRTRAWVWFVVAVLGNPALMSFERPLEQEYENQLAPILANYLPVSWILPFFVAYAFGIQVIYGLVAAFLMPPVKKSLPT